MRGIFVLGGIVTVLAAICCVFVQERPVPIQPTLTGPDLETQMTPESSSLTSVEEMKVAPKVSFWKNLVRLRLGRAEYPLSDSEGMRERWAGDEVVKRADSGVLFV